MALLLHEGIVASAYVCAMTQSNVVVADYSALDDVTALSDGVVSRPSPDGAVRNIPNILSRFDQVYRPSLRNCRLVSPPGDHDPVVQMVVREGTAETHFLFPADFVRGPMWECLLHSAWWVFDPPPAIFHALITDLVPDFFEGEAHGEDSQTDP
jgi:hypothetical protein